MMTFRTAFSRPVTGLFLLAVTACLPGAADACTSTSACEVGNGVYRIVLPQEPIGRDKIGAIFFFHGFTGSALETVTTSELVDVASKEGVALVAAEGLGGRWSLPGVGEPQRDEIAYVERVVADAVLRFNLDPERLMASGFSLGGSMVWYLACRIPGRFAAFAPIAGAFWEPIPESCAGARPPMIHFHGLSDATVPIAGRQVRSGRRQADVYKSLALFAPACELPSRAEAKVDPLSCRVSSGCPGEARLELCLHPGGHDLNAEWVGRAWRIMMEREAPPSEAAHVSVKP